jgi:chromosome segregation ATPase
MARFETLEAHVVNLVDAFTRLKAEKQMLSQRVQQLQDVVDAQQQELSRLRPTQDELTHLRTVMQTLRQERHVIREKLEQMLVTIEWLEECSHADSNPKV